ncbi:MAG: hypothetical protein QMD09_09360 [Desulfatibacillaceae bacterium]|nr:hypothetical protein [Desulfatibacillaceae bacterium]
MGYRKRSPTKGLFSAAAITNPAAFRSSPFCLGVVLKNCSPMAVRAKKQQFKTTKHKKTHKQPNRLFTNNITPCNNNWLCGIKLVMPCAGFSGLCRKAVFQGPGRLTAGLDHCRACLHKGPVEAVFLNKI